MSVEPAHTELIQSFLRDRTIGCPACGYNLRGLAGHGCPECGALLELRLASSKTRMGWWVGSLLAVVLPLGFHATLAVTGIIAATRQPSWWWRTNDWYLVGLSWGMALGLSTLAIFLIRRRHKFLMRTHVEQKVRAAGWWLCMIALHATTVVIYARMSSSLFW